MLKFTAGKRNQIPTKIFEGIGAYRREVFIRQLGWDLKTVNGMELDQFDSENAVYVCLHDHHSQVGGVARLLPTTTPYLMKEFFPQLWREEYLPSTDYIWELSRFSAVAPCSEKTEIFQVSSKWAAELLEFTMQTASKLGAHELITVSPVAVERLLKWNGFNPMRAGPEFSHLGSKIVALKICLKRFF